MRKPIFIILIFLSLQCLSQNQLSRDTTLNNLVLPKGYLTAEYGAIPQYKKSGKGEKAMILIPGWGFDRSVFDDFVSANKSKYTMYTITVPGFGGTSSPPLPKEGTSYGDQSWNKSVLEGLAKLIDKEHLQQPTIVGHFTLGTQLALRMAIDFPDKVGGVIILGGPVKMVIVQEGNAKSYPLKSMIYYADKVSGPTFYKTVTKSYWDQNNYMRELYSLQSAIGDKLWRQSADVPMQVMIRYLLEFHASDVTLEANKIKCPVLVIRPGFKNEWLSDAQNGSLNYIKPQFIDSWEALKNSTPSLEIQDVKDSGVFLWKDQPQITYRLLDEFVARVVKVEKKN